MRILVVAPHADDETLGVGGTIARHANEGHDVIVAVMTGHGDGVHPLWPREGWDIVRAEAREAHALLGVRETIFEEIPAAMVADQPAWQLNKITDRIIEQVAPDILYVPFLFDLHKDHRELAHSFSVAWRPHKKSGRAIREIYAYETVSETHWACPQLEPGFIPNRWIDISRYLSRKLEAIACFKSQMRPFPDARSVEAIDALAKWRGTQMSMRAAEAFVIIRQLCLAPEETISETAVA